MDGSNPEILLEFTNTKPEFITVDIEAKKLYWSSSNRAEVNVLFVLIIIIIIIATITATSIFLKKKKKKKKKKKLFTIISKQNIICISKLFPVIYKTIKCCDILKIVDVLFIYRMLFHLQAAWR